MNAIEQIDIGESNWPGRHFRWEPGNGIKYEIAVFPYGGSLGLCGDVDKGWLVVDGYSRRAHLSKAVGFSIQLTLPRSSTPCARSMFVTLRFSSVMRSVVELHGRWQRKSISHVQHAETVFSRQTNSAMPAKREASDKPRLRKGLSLGEQ